MLSIQPESRSVVDTFDLKNVRLCQVCQFELRAVPPREGEMNPWDIQELKGMVGIFVQTILLETCHECGGHTDIVPSLCLVAGLGQLGAFLPSGEIYTVYELPRI